MNDQQQTTLVLTYDHIENDSARSSEIIQRLCFELGGHLAANPLYRSFQLIQAIECIVALISLPIVHFMFLLRAALHMNLKALLCLYFLICFAYVLTVFTCLMYELVLWQTCRNPCDMFPSRRMYTFYSITELYCLLHMSSMQVVISFERAVATIYVDTYESWRAPSAVFFALSTFMIPGILTTYIYAGVVFTEPNLCSFTDQSMVKNKISEVSVLVILSCLLGVAVQRVLATVNRKRSARSIAKPFTTRYQLSENIAGTDLTSNLQILQVSASILYAVLSLICIGIPLGKAENERDTNLIAKEGCYIIPLAVAILPFLTLHVLKKRQRLRNNAIQQSVTRTTADDQMAVYANMLRQQWE
ncbi:hypothetical protein GCK32_008106 [Trichostrongylus colubriformis]|uniref:Uncharacterized protein n=1 Tax=Trichostrongylus colubriformis TaxID=6319 RepID=A0AAN8FJE6_TRICO